jgi:hypothetical protein
MHLMLTSIPLGNNKRIAINPLSGSGHGNNKITNNRDKTRVRSQLSTRP